MTFMTNTQSSSGESEINLQSDGVQELLDGIGADRLQIALIYFNAGGGHRAAAHALQSQLSRRHPNWDIALSPKAFQNEGACDRECQQRQNAQAPSDPHQWD